MDVDSREAIERQRAVPVRSPYVLSLLLVVTDMVRIHAYESSKLDILMLFHSAGGTGDDKHYNKLFYIIIIKQ